MAIQSRCIGVKFSAIKELKYTVKIVQLFSKLNNRPKSIQFIVKYSVVLIVILSILQIVYVASIVPLYLKALNNYDPFSGTGDLESVGKQVGPIVKFISGVSSGFIATLVEIALVSAFRLNKPYRQRSYVNLVAFTFLSALMGFVYTFAIFTGRQPLSAQNIGSILSFFILLPIAPYLFKKVLREWSKAKPVDFPDIDMNA